jgi:hypothetical protein
MNPFTAAHRNRFQILARYGPFDNHAFLAALCQKEMQIVKADHRDAANG